MARRAYPVHLERRRLQYHIHPGRRNRSSPARTASPRRRMGSARIMKSGSLLSTRRGERRSSSWRCSMRRRTRPARGSGNQGRRSWGRNWGFVWGGSFVWPPEGVDLDGVRNIVFIAGGVGIKYVFHQDAYHNNITN